MENTIQEEELSENDLEILDDMYEFEEDFEENEKSNGQYLIGIYIYMNDTQLVNSTEKQTVLNNSKQLFLGMAVSPTLFFKYEYKYIQKYVSSCIVYGPYLSHTSLDLKINIMKLQITKNNLYLVEVKSYWLKLIQRHWKNIIKKRKEIIEEMKKVSYLKLREIGKSNKKKMPKLHGMMSIYNNFNKMD
jgi:hypothetical protein